MSTSTLFMQGQYYHIPICPGTTATEFSFRVFCLFVCLFKNLPVQKIWKLSFEQIQSPTLFQSTPGAGVQWPCHKVTEACRANRTSSGNSQHHIPVERYQTETVCYVHKGAGVLSVLLFGKRNQHLFSIFHWHEISISWWEISQMSFLLRCLSIISASMESWTWSLG